MASSLRLFRDHVLVYPAGFTVLLALLLARSALLLYIPLVVAGFITQVQSGASAGELQSTALVFIALAAGQVVAGVLLETTAQRVGWKATNHLRDDLLRRVLSGRTSESSDSASAAELVERIEVDSALLARLFSSLLPQLLTACVLTIGAVVVSATVSPLAGMAVLGYVLVSATALGWTKRITDRHVLEASNIRTEVFRDLGDMVAARESIGVNSDDRGVQRMLTLLRKWFPVRHLANRAATSMWTSSIAVYALAATAVLILAPVLNGGPASVALAILVIQYMDTVQRPLEQLREEMQELPEAQASATRVSAFKARHPYRRGPEPADTLENAPVGITLDDVAFSYTDGTPVLDGLTVHVPPGGVLALTGRTGSGKSTTLRLLLGELEPDRGKIEIGGQDPASLGADRAAHLFGTVDQGTAILPGTLQENLTLFSGHIDDIQLTDVLCRLGLDTWPDRYPDKLAHRISGPADLATGETRIIALVRAVLRRPPVLVLDEVTAGLDDYWTSTVEDALAHLSLDSTIVLATHSPALRARATNQVHLRGRGQEHSCGGQYVV